MKLSLDRYSNEFIISPRKYVNYRKKVSYAKIVRLWVDDER